MTEQELGQKIASLLMSGNTQKDVGSTNAQQMIYGPGGLYGTDGLSPEVISTLYQPKGMATILPKVPSRSTYPFYPFLTGQEADSGTEPTESCGTPVKVGAKKAGTLTAQFGMLQRATETIDVSKLAEQLNRGEMHDLRLLGDLSNSAVGLGPMQFGDGQRVLNSAVYNAMNSLAISFARNLSEQLWQGSPTGGTDGFTEFPGFDAQITTGQVDAKSNTAIAAADSDVKDFNYSNIDGTDTNDIYNYITMLEYYITDLAERTGMNGEWVWVMRPQVWEELSAVWPISYGTVGASQVIDNTNARLFVNASESAAQRDLMRNNMVLKVRGKTYPVITDTGIAEATNITYGNLALGEYSSSIYFVCLRANGLPVTRLEYLDYNAIGRDIAAINGLSTKVNFWTPDGMFMYTYNDNDSGFCFDIHGRTQQRLVVQAPHLCGRIDNVKYSPLQHIREPYPDSPYFLNGGVSQQATPTTYKVWG